MAEDFIPLSEAGKSSDFIPLSDIQPSRMESAGRAIGGFLNSILPSNPTARDIIQSGVSGVARGAAHLVGLPGTLSGGVPISATAFNPALSGSFDDVSPTVTLPTGGQIETRMHDVGMLHDPQTLPGRFADTMGQFAGQAGMLGGGARGLLMALGGGAGSEAGGQIAAGTPAEPWARLSGGLLGTGLTGIALPQTNAGSMLRDRLAGTTRAELDQARDRLAEGQRIGAPLSPVEALENRAVQSLAADTMASPTGGPQMGRFLDQRAQNLPGTIRDKIAPDLASASPEMRAAGAREASNDLSNRARAAGYAAADAQTLDRAALDPVIQKVATAWQDAPVQAKKALADLYDNLAASGGNVRKVHDAWEIAKKSIAPSDVPLPPALAADHIALANRMQPLIDDIRGALQTNVDYRRGLATYTKEAKSAEVMRAFDKALEKERPTQAGSSRMVGVDVRNRLLGNDPGTAQTEKTLDTIREAATRMGKNPDEAVAGAQRVFDVLERQGRIPGVGSPTVGRGQAAAEAANTGALGEVARTNITQPLSFIDRVLARTFQRGAYRQLGDVFTNPSPEAIDIMLRMSRMNDQSAALLLPSLLSANQRETQ